MRISLQEPEERPTSLLPGRARAWLGGWWTALARGGPQAVWGQYWTGSPRFAEIEETAGMALRVSRNTWRACRAHLAHWLPTPSSRRRSRSCRNRFRLLPVS